MLTRIKNDKRYCLDPAKGMLISWDYIKQVLIESGFQEVQKASPSEYIMRGCNDSVLVYVKFPTTFESSIVFINSSDRSTSMKLNWTNEEDFPENGNQILEGVRGIWKTL